MADPFHNSGVRGIAELDRKLSGVFKALLKGSQDGGKEEKARKDFGAVCERVVDATFSGDLKRLFDAFRVHAAQRMRRDAEESLACVLDLRDRGFVETASILFFEWREVLASLSFERVLKVAPDTACVEAWLKASKASVAEIEEQLLADPGATYATAGADWLMLRAKPNRRLPLLELFLSRRPRLPYLRPWDDAVIAALKKDKRSVLLGEALRHSWPSEDCLATLAKAVRANRALLRTTVDSLPELLAQKDMPATAARFVGEIFREVVITDGAEREFMTTALARLGTGILLGERKGAQSEAAFAVIQSTARQLRNLTRDEVLQARTWLLENLGRQEESTSGHLRVSTEGARHVALAIEKATKGFAAKDVLMVLARNVGFSLVGTPGELVAYDPLRHEDLQGGLVPGASVCVEEPGWAIQRETLIRAKVKPTQGGSHV